MCRLLCRLLLNDESLLDKSLCQVLWYNATRTRCQCTLDGNKQSRKLSTLDNTEVGAYVETYTVVMMAEHVGDTFVETIRTADTTSLSTFRKAVIVIIFNAAVAALVMLSIVNPISMGLEMMNSPKTRIRKRASAVGVVNDNSANDVPSASQSQMATIKLSPKQFLVTYIESVLPA